MSQILNTILNYKYEVRSTDVCTITDCTGIHIGTAIPGCVAEFYGNGHPVTLSSDSAVMKLLPYRPDFIPWVLVSVVGTDAQVHMKHKTLYRAGALLSLTLQVDSVADDFFSELCFTSGSTPTELSMPGDWKWSGDDLSNGAFVPQPDTRYRVVVISDGVFIRASVEGVTI